MTREEDCAKQLHGMDVPDFVLLTAHQPDAAAKAIPGPGGNAMSLANLGGAMWRYLSGEALDVSRAFRRRRRITKGF